MKTTTRRIAIALPAVVTLFNVLMQQILFNHFVAEAGHVTGVFHEPRGAYYRLWSLTVPLFVTTALIAVLAFAGAMIVRKREGAWRSVFLWLIYTVGLWMVTAASSILVEILGNGEAFL